MEWMKNSPSEEYRWVYSRFQETAKHKDGGLDASDGGMAFVLATRDLNGNFAPKLKELLGTDWKESSADKSRNDASEKLAPNKNTKVQNISIIIANDDEIALSKPVRWAMINYRNL